MQAKMASSAQESFSKTIKGAEELLYWLDCCGLQTEGLWRLPGDAIRQRELQELIARERSPGLTMEDDSHTVVQVALWWLKTQVPGRVFSQEQLHYLSEAHLIEGEVSPNKVPTSAWNTDKIKAVLSQLSPEKSRVLKVFVQHWRRVIDHQTINKMSAKNIATSVMQALAPETGGTFEELVTLHGLHGPLTAILERADAFFVEWQGDNHEDEPPSSPSLPQGIFTIHQPSEGTAQSQALEMMLALHEMEWDRVAEVPGGATSPALSHSSGRLVGGQLPCCWWLANELELTPPGGADPEALEVALSIMGLWDSAMALRATVTSWEELDQRLPKVLHSRLQALEECVVQNCPESCGQRDRAPFLFGALSYVDFLLLNLIEGLTAALGARRASLICECIPTALSAAEALRKEPAIEEYLNAAPSILASDMRHNGLMPLQGHEAFSLSKSLWLHDPRWE